MTPQQVPDGREMLKKGTVKCPACKELLHFKTSHGMRVIDNDFETGKCIQFVSGKCVKCKIYYRVKPDNI
jgi:phage FluMu protein Com